MISKIVFTYKFIQLPNATDLIEECKMWLITILDKFDPSKGFKAFSYFSVITKNWFIHKTKKHQKQNKTEISLEDKVKIPDIGIFGNEYVSRNSYIDDRSKVEFLDFIMEEMDIWLKIEDLREYEKKILYAIQIILTNPQIIEIYNKKAIFVYLREMTGLNTKQITTNLSRLRKRYEEARKYWDNEIY